MKRRLLSPRCCWRAAAAPPGTCSRSSAPAPTGNANLTLVVSDDGYVTCNGTQHELPPKLLLRARQLTRDLSVQAELNLAPGPGPNSILAYKARMQAGSVTFADTSRPLPASFTELTVYTKRCRRAGLRDHPRGLTLLQMTRHHRCVTARVT